MSYERMARTKITSADCVLPEMKGKFDLSFYVSQRARALINGSKPLVEGFDKPKNHAVMVAMEEIRSGQLTFDDMLVSLATPEAEPQHDGENKFMSLVDNKNYHDGDIDDEDDEDEEELDYSETEESYED